MILALVAVEVTGERRAERAVAALRQLAEPSAAVRRAGRVREVPREEVVPGDVVLLQAGRRVAADARLIAAYGLAVDESALTGESIPVEKDAEAVAFSGTLVVRGRGEAEVVATGDATELGRLARRAREAKPPPTPLDRAMRELSRSLLVAALAISLTVPIVAWRLRDGVTLTTCSADDLIVHKAFAGRDLDWGDVERVLICQHGKLHLSQIQAATGRLLSRRHYER